MQRTRLLSFVLFALSASSPAQSNPALFASAVTYSSGGYSPTSVAVADVNGDGKPDLVVANLCVSSDKCPNGSVSVLLGNGDDTFNRPSATILAVSMPSRWQSQI